MIRHHYMKMDDGTYVVGYIRPGRVEHEFVPLVINIPTQEEAISEVGRLDLEAQARQMEQVDERFRIVCEVVS